MTLQPTTGHEPADGPQTGRPSRNDALYLLAGLLALSALVVYVVLQVMAASSAAATGGCGGG
jgi:hypothetical protein